MSPLKKKDSLSPLTDRTIIEPAAYRMAAALAALQVKGVSSLANMSENWDGKTASSLSSSAVVLKERAGQLHVEVRINAFFKEKIPALCARVQNAVRAVLELMTEREIFSVSVVVVGVVAAKGAVRVGTKKVTAKSVARGSAKKRS